MATQVVHPNNIPPSTAVEIHLLRNVNYWRRMGLGVNLVPDSDGSLDSSGDITVTGTSGEMYAMLGIVNEVQTVVVDATGGTFTLTFMGQTTGTIAANSTAATVQTAMEALSNVAPGDVTVVRSGSVNAYTYTFTFTGVWAGTDVNAMTADATLLTGGAQTAVVATTTVGANSTQAAGSARWCIFSVA